MIKNMLIESDYFLEIIKSPSNFVDILHKSRKTNCTVKLAIDDNLENIYEKLHDNRRNEDVILISRGMERNNIVFEDESEFRSNKRLATQKNEEAQSLQDIQRHMRFNIQNPNIIFTSNKSSIREVRSIEEFKEVLLLGISELEDVQLFIDNLKLILDEIVFDVDIITSINKLKAGFENRRPEILYHLFCIEIEIPLIIGKGINDYAAIGKELSISCSPERSRKTVEDELTKILGDYKINCELHTKMNRVGSDAPDRIYFCPCIKDIEEDTLKDKIYIYKISEHV